MNNELDDLKNKWKGAKHALETKSQPVETLIAQAKAKKKSMVYFHYGNIIVLTVLMILLILCFLYLFPFRETLSRSGVALMIGGLALRILIEIGSVIKSRKINLGDYALKATNDTLAFYKFRKWVHGPVTISIVGLYTAGFYMLTPEFSKYIELKWMIAFDIIYVIGAVFLIWQIGKEIRKELKDLEDIIQLKAEITRED